MNDDNDKNLISHWNERFCNGGSWEKSNGIRQTIYWAKVILEYLPAYIKKDIKDNKFSIADIGCGLGQMSQLFKKTYKDSRVVGYDFSNVAIDRCIEKYNNIEFFNSNIEENYDVVVLSNIIEHVRNPVEMVSEHMQYTNKYLIVLCPYMENPNKLISEHVISIDEDILTYRIDGFRKVFQKINNVAKSSHWFGNVIFCVYKREIKGDICE